VNWFWIIVGAVAIFFIWKSRGEAIKFAQKRVDSVVDRPDEYSLAVARQQREMTNRTRLSVIGTILVVLFVGYNGVWSPMQENQAQSAIEDEWFSTYTQRHQTTWNQACDAFFSVSANGVMYRNGEPRDAAWCRGEWRPPRVPSEYSNSEYDAPESVAPFASQAVFGMNLFDVTFCESPYDDSTCYSYDEFRGSGP
jgi:hypothetical protein